MAGNKNSLGSKHQGGGGTVGPSVISSLPLQTGRVERSWSVFYLIVERDVVVVVSTKDICYMSVDEKKIEKSTLQVDACEADVVVSVVSNWLKQMISQHLDPRLVYARCHGYVTIDWYNTVLIHTGMHSFPSEH